MATYTTRIMTLVDGYAQTNPGLSIAQKINVARPKLFDFDYPFFDEGLRSEFEEHFIRNFYTREIGFETEGLFKFKLENWLTIHMPYFNRLFESETIRFNPLENVNVGINSNLKNQKDQNDVIDRIEDEKENQTGTLDRDVLGNQTINTDQKTHDESEQNQNNTGTANTVTTSETDTTNNTTGSTDTTQNNFDREIASDTPQSRLNLTTNDGSGIIEYASSIKEDKEKNIENRDMAENQTGNEQTTANQITNTTNDLNQSSTSDGTLNVDTTSKATEATDEKTNKDTVKNKIGNQKLDSAIQVLEDFAKKEIGKTGGITYSQMLTEYRSTFLRIEKEIFDEMQELFMLVY